MSFHNSQTPGVLIERIDGDGAITVVTNNPYQLAADIYGIGFLTADKIARNLGVPPDSEFRYRAGITHVLSEAAEDGHCYLPQPELIQQAIKLLTFESHQPTENALAPIIQKMTLASELVRESTADKTLLCYKPTFFYTEQNLAQLISDRILAPINPDIPRVRSWIARFTQSRKIELSPQQQEAVEVADLNEIALAWSVTIHKSQGSEYPVVILPLYTQHYIMLSRNLLYTGLTRAKKLAIIIGSKKAIGMAVRSVNKQQRYTQLAKKLIEVSPFA
jgi:ATP-dependent exoDNAse (exonuclease V) alpha subunit